MVVDHRVGVAVVAAALVAVAACSSDEPTTAPTSELTSSFSSYVAIGDSFVAGPGIDPVDPDSRRCQRSLNNYPTLVAEELRIPSLKDVSCSGATSLDIYEARTGPTAAQPLAQTEAISPSTDLVTVSIGGNDEGVFGRIISSCTVGSVAPDACSPFVDTQLDRILKRTTSNIAVSLEKIREKAPNARIVLVGYLRLIPEKGGCTTPGLDAAYAGPAAAAQDALTAALEAAAKRASVEYISISDLSTGHESCAGDDAWVNGLKTAPGDGAFLHPNAAGMRAVAGAIAKHLRQQ